MVDGRVSGRSSQGRFLLGGSAPLTNKDTLQHAAPRSQTIQAVKSPLGIPRKETMFASRIAPCAALFAGMAGVMPPLLLDAIFNDTGKILPLAFRD